MSYVSDKLRQKIIKQARNRCGYCLGEQRYILVPLEIDHLLPTAKGGTDDEENLWLACPLCNAYKGTKTHGVDLQTRRKVSLYNPRKQHWKRHFIIVNGVRIVGKTAIGRTTIFALRMNNRISITVRQNWFLAGWYPPSN